MSKNSDLYRSGINFLGILNDLKRRPEDAAKELGVSLEEILSVIKGEKELSHDIIKRAAEIWSVNISDFYLIHDDSPNGVKIMRAEESQKSSRIMDRGGDSYYEYRDTAMSSISLFRPEWIEELCIVDDNEPNNPTVQWNDGHFMHQFTYFIGDVNYYWEESDGRKKVAVMNTGDSMYGTPFRPHTFATRKGASKNGLILALTYGNNLMISQQELSTLGVELGLNFYLDFSTKERAFSSLLKFSRENASLTHEELAKRSGIPKETIEGLENSITSLPDDKILSKLAKALNVNVRDLYPPDSIEDKVIVRYYKDAPRWFYPESKAYEIVELAYSRYLPFSKALEFNIKKSENDQILDIKMGLHQYIYNVGDSPVEFNWKINNIMNHEKINPGDSIYVKPFVPHNFRGNGKLMVLRIAGRIAGDAQRELSTLDKNDAHRAILETSMWFDPKGKN